MLIRIFLFRLSALVFTTLVLTACGTDSGPEAIPPVLNLPSKIDAIVGQPVDYTINVTDPQDLETELLVEGLPAWLEYVPATKSLQGTPVEGDDGRFELTITAQN